MLEFRKTLGFVLLAMATTGCRSQQLAHDQDHIRSAVMHLHENQIMDNLVRARKGLPILHLDYVNMTGTITQTGNAAGGGSYSAASNRFASLPASALALSRVVTGAGNLSAGATQVNQLTITAQPVNGAPEVYNAYLSFLKDPDRLREGPQPPGCDEALIFRCYEDPCPEPCGTRAWGSWFHKRVSAKTYYWIPRQHADAFRELSVYAVAVRGQAAPLSSNFDVTALGVKKFDPIAQNDKDNYELYVKIDRKIPNDKGYLVMTINGKLYEEKGLLTVLINSMGGLKRAQPGLVLEPEMLINVIRLSINLKTLGVARIDDVVMALDNRRIGIRLENFVPTASPTDRVLQDLRMQAELFRLGQVK
jgi:hypothetical protein